MGRVQDRQGRRAEGGEGGGELAIHASGVRLAILFRPILQYMKVYVPRGRVACVCMAGSSTCKG